MTLTIAPGALRRTMSRTTACIVKYGPRRFTATCASNSSGVVSTSVPRDVRPAELTRQSTRPNSAMAVCTAARACATLLTSACTNRAVPFCSASSATSFSPGSRRRPVTTTAWAPSRTAARAIDAPSPWLPPLMNTIFFSSRGNIGAPRQPGSDRRNGDMPCAGAGHVTEAVITPAVCGVGLSRRIAGTTRAVKVQPTIKARTSGTRTLHTIENLHAPIAAGERDDRRELRRENRAILVEHLPNSRSHAVSGTYVRTGGLVGPMTEEDRERRARPEPAQRDRPVVVVRHAWDAGGVVRRDRAPDRFLPPGRLAALHRRSARRNRSRAATPEPAVGTAGRCGRRPARGAGRVPHRTAGGPGPPGATAAAEDRRRHAAGRGALRQVRPGQGHRAGPVHPRRTHHAQPGGRCPAHPRANLHRLAGRRWPHLDRRARARRVRSRRVRPGRRRLSAPGDRARRRLADPARAGGRA